MKSPTVQYFLDRIEDFSPNYYIRAYDSMSVTAPAKIINLTYKKEYVISLYEFFLNYIKPHNEKKYESYHELQGYLDHKFGDNSFKIMSRYIDQNTPILVKHIPCGHTFKITPYALEIKEANTCINCTKYKSIGETIIQNHLTDLNIPFVPQYKDERCRDKNVLPYDFAIMSNDNKLVALIEYDGIQHYQPVDKFGGEEAFLTTMHHDMIKNTFCEYNNIPLLRISYKDKKNIHKIIDDFLKIA